MNRDEYLALMMNRAIFMLSNAVDDVRLSRYSPQECRHLADGLDQLSCALRDEDQTIVINGEVRS